MLKKDELTNPNSCLNRAQDNEMTFVLLGRDPAARVAVQVWIEERIRIGKNKRTDPQIQEAGACQELMAPALMQEEKEAGLANALQGTLRQAFRLGLNTGKGLKGISAYNLTPEGVALYGETTYVDFKELAQLLVEVMKDNKRGEFHD